MAQRTSLAAVLNGLVRNVDLTADELVLDSVRLGGLAGTLLTKTILDGLISNSHAPGSDNQNIIAGEALTGGGSGASVTLDVNVDNTTIEVNADALRLKDAAVSASKLAASAITGQTEETVADDADSILIYDDSGTALKKMTRANFLSGTTTDEKVKISANDTTTGYLEDKVVSANNLLTVSTLNDGGDEDLQLQVNQSNIDHGSIAGLGDDDHTQYIRVDGTRAFTGDQSMGSNQLTNVADPIAAQDAATKAYVDSLLDGRSWKQSVRAASTANLDLSSMPASVDGITLSNGDRFLAKDQTAPAENGIYIFNGAASAATRSSDANTALELEGAAVFVEEGTANADKQFAQTSDNFTLDTDPVVWVVTSANAFSGHDMIVLSGGQISVDLAAVSGLESTNAGNAAGQLRIKLEASNPSLQITGSNELAAKLDAAGAISSGAGGLSVNTDDSTIEKNANALRVKAAGITESHLNASVAGDGLTGGAGSPLAVGAGDGIDVAADAISVDVSDLAGSGLENDGSNNLRIASSAAGAGLAGGSGSALSVAYAPQAKKSMVAGEAFAANTSFLVRFAVSGETAGRVYKADSAAAVANGEFWAIGMALSTSAVSAGQNIDVVLLGTHTLGSSDTNFGAGDIGKAVWLTDAGAFSVTAPTDSGDAAFRVGSVEDVDKVFIDGKQLTGIN